MQLGRLAILLGAATAACGDGKPAAGPPLAPATDLVIVAHQGDELRYMGNDVADEIGTTPVTTVVVTAGTSETASDPGEASAARGVEAAYASLAGVSVDGWDCGPITVAGHGVRHCRLADGNASLVFLDLPAGNHDGSATQSLLHLWEAQAPTIASVSDAKVTYNQAELIATLSAIVQASAPATLRTLELAATHGDDHSDHMLVGAAAWLALAASPIGAAPELLAYRGDNIAGEAANVTASARGQLAFAYYAACTAGCGTCGTACTADQLAAADVALRQRAYPIHAQAQATGALQIAGQCASFPTVGDNGSLVACQAGAQVFTYQAVDLVVRDPAGCVRSLFTAELVEDSQCAADDPGVHFLSDEEGHLWFGVVPAPAADMSFAHLACMDAVGGRPRGALCGASHDVKVMFRP